MLRGREAKDGKVDMESAQQVFERGMAAHQRGDLAGASVAYGEALRLDGGFMGARKALAVLKAQTGDLDGAIVLMREGTTIAPEDGENWSNLCFALSRREFYEESVAAGQRAVELDSNNAFAHNNLSAVLRMVNRYEDSWNHARRALQINPKYVEAKVNAACCLNAIGEVDSATALLSEAVQDDPKNTYARDSYLFSLHYSEQVTSAEIREIHELFGHAMGCPPRPELPEAARTVGFVSGDLVRHPVGFFMKALLANLDRKRWRIAVFHNREEEDDLSVELRGHADVWHKISRLEDRECASLVQRESVDILVDLSGFTAKNRMGVLALRPAPVQATFLGYSSTTGMKSVDFLISDEVLVPAEFEGLYTEQIARLDRCLYCMDVQLRDFGAVPAGPVVFGSFNNPYKISDSAVGAWAQILGRVDGSRLLMKYSSLDSSEVRQAMVDRFARHGVGADRLEFVDTVPYEEHLRILGSVAVSLDSFPYTGATTTVDALKSGTPVVTLAGDRYNTRMTATVLKSLGLGELVTDSVEAYVDLAVKLATDREYRAGVLDKLRNEERLRGFSDGVAYARSFEKVLSDMWDEVLAIKT